MAERARGSVFTPLPLAEHLVRAALEGRPAPRTACDPAAGDGRLLAAVAERSEGPVELFAADIDGDAWSRGPLAERRQARFATGDALGRGAELWPDAPPGGFDLVVGNPPFLSQRSTRTVRTTDQRRRAAGLDVGGMADSAAAFLVASCEMLAPGGRVAMIMPLSFLSTSDAAPARRRVLQACRLSGIWVSAGMAFQEADVETCALLLDRVDRQGRVRRWSGPGWTRATDAASRELGDAATWSHLVSDLLGDLPEDDLVSSGGRLGDIAGATAGFRDQFYGLAPLAQEVPPPAAGRADGFLPLITSGAIDPGHVRWGDAETRLSGRTLLRPAIDPGDLAADAALDRWVAARRVPKVLVATQTRVIEAVADPTGEWIPSTPVVSVECEPAELWRVLAVLLAPPTSLWARRHFAGAARSTRAIKLSARQVLDIPLPVEPSMWAAAASRLQAAHDVESGGASRDAVVEAAEAMCEAYGVGAAVSTWWSSQLPRRAPDR